MLTILTIPIVLYGVLRYLYLSYIGARDQSPERLMLTDTPLLIAVGLWALGAVGILYVGGGQ